MRTAMRASVRLIPIGNSAFSVDGDICGSILESDSYECVKAPLNPEFYEVDFEFFSKQTGITDPEKLKQHVIKVQAEAYEVNGLSTSALILRLDELTTYHRSTPILAYGPSVLPSEFYREYSYRGRHLLISPELKSITTLVITNSSRSEKNGLALCFSMLHAQSEPTLAKPLRMDFQRAR